MVSTTLDTRCVRGSTRFAAAPSPSRRSVRAQGHVGPHSMHTPRAKVGHHHPLIMHSLCRAHICVLTTAAHKQTTDTYTQVGHHTARASLPPQRGVGGVRGAPARAKHLLYGVDVFMACCARRLTGEDIHTTSDVKTRGWPHVHVLTY